MFINPRVTPRGNVGPMAAVIRSPAGLDCSRDPYMSIFRLVSPSPLLVEIFITDDVGRNIARGLRVLPSSITCFTPALERILIRGVVQPVFAQLVVAREHRVFPFADR